LRASIVLAGAWLVFASASCGRGGLYPVLRASPSVAIEPLSPLAGRPLVLRYRWGVDPAFTPPTVPLRAFVHFLLPDGRLAFTDDHEPAPPVALWQPGATYSYSRTVVLPDRLQGLKVRVGFFSNKFPYKVRVLDPKSRRPSFPDVAEFAIADNPGLDEEAVAGGSGFQPWEQDGQALARVSRWMGSKASFTFLQRPEGVALFVQGYTERGRFQRDPLLALRVGEHEQTQLISNADRLVMRLEVPGDGTARLVQGSVDMDQTFTDGGRELAFCVERFRSVPLPALR